MNVRRGDVVLAMYPFASGAGASRILTEAGVATGSDGYGLSKCGEKS